MQEPKLAVYLLLAPHAFKNNIRHLDLRLNLLMRRPTWANTGQYVYYRSLAAAAAAVELTTTCVTAEDDSWC